MKREIGAVALVAGAAEEVLISLEHTDMLRHILPSWFTKVVNQEIALALILVGMVVLLLRERSMKESHTTNQTEHQKQTPEPSASSPLTASATAQSKSGDTQIGDFRSGDVKTGDVHVHIPLPVAAPVKSPLPKQPQAEPKPNIVFKNVRPAWLKYFDQDGFFAEVESSYGVRAIIARFKNESAAAMAADVQYVRAELIFRDVNEQELEQGVHSACWLRELADTVDFDVGQGHWLVLAIVGRNDETGWVVPWIKPNTDWQGTSYDLEMHKIPDIHSIEIRLIGPSRNWLSKPVIIDVVLNNGEPATAVRPPKRAN